MGLVPGSAAGEPLVEALLSLPLGPAVEQQRPLVTLTYRAAAFHQSLTIGFGLHAPGFPALSLSRTCRGLGNGWPGIWVNTAYVGIYQQAQDAGGCRCAVVV